MKEYDKIREEYQKMREDVEAMEKWLFKHERLRKLISLMDSPNIFLVEYLEAVPVLERGVCSRTRITPEVAEAFQETLEVMLIAFEENGYQKEDE